MKRFSFMLFLLSGLLAFVPGTEDPLDRLLSSLEGWVKDHPVEKVYLHTDKPYYAVGDTLWFKAYVTVGAHHQLSKLSGALYVELINEKDSLMHSVKLPLNAGMALGDFTIGDAYPQGNYRLRAYTRWMRNAGEDYFYDHTFAVGDPLSLDPGAEGGSGSGMNNRRLTGGGTAQPDSVGLSRTDVQFFPEGGSFVAGLATRIAFKATGVNGLGMDVRGIISDNTGKQLTEFKTDHAGMGTLVLTAEAGKRYSALVKYADGSSNSYPLPAVQASGYSLSVFALKPDSLLVRIQASSGLYGAEGESGPMLSLVVQSSGEVVDARAVRMAHAIESVWIARKSFPGGIAQFSLFNGRNEPLNERIAFIKTNDRMQVRVHTSKPVYGSRERVELNLEARDSYGDPVAGNFSVSVVDEGKVRSDESAESTIFSNLLLSSELKGYIEKPNYYFTADNQEVNKALDNLMLTQGYRRFVWKDMINITSAPGIPLYKAESLGTEISGRVLTLTGKPVVNGIVTLMSLNPGFMDQTRTDANGLFSYEPIMLADSLKFAVQATTSKKKKKVEVVLDEVPPQGIGKNPNSADYIVNIPARQADYLANSRQQDALQERMGRQSRVNRLKEVKITAKRRQEEAATVQGTYVVPESFADQTFIAEGLEDCPMLATCLQGKLNGVFFMPLTTAGGVLFPHYPKGPTMLPFSTFLDGRKLSQEDAINLYQNNYISPSDILKIQVVKYNQTMLQYLNTPPALMIITKKKKSGRYTPNIVNIKPRGFNMVREFYAPRYDRPGLHDQLPDLRSTIYWNANVKTYASGSTGLSYFNADGPGTYRVTVEGINAAGELSRTVFRYQVSGDGALSNTASALPSASSLKLSSRLEAYHKEFPREKLYLHMDKSSYNLGDTLWFKAYLLDGGTLSASRKSGLLYVELNDDTAEAVRRISIPVKEGLGYAQIPLPAKIFHEGGYTLRAYTNWMQNFGSDVFFTQRFYLGTPNPQSWLVNPEYSTSTQADKTRLDARFQLSRQDHSAVALREVEVRIMEGKTVRYKERLQTDMDGRLGISYALKDKAAGRMIRAEIRSLHANDGNQRLVIPLSIRRAQKIDLQFLPEGGHLVAGLPGVLGFKALSEDGKGIAVRGAVYDSKDQQVAVFSSLHKGMGHFGFTPAPGESYTAKILAPAQVSGRFSLPAAEAAGTVMHLNNENPDRVHLRLTASSSALNADSSYYLLGTSAGRVFYVKSLDLDAFVSDSSGRSCRLEIDSKVFPTGIARFTLLRNQTPLNQRIVFIDHQDRLKIHLSSSKDSYYKRDSVSLSISVEDKSGHPVQGHFSLSVTDDSQVKGDTAGHHDIAAALWLGSELKGEIEEPGYYLNPDHRLALDELMLTQGWTGFDWKAVFSAPVPPVFEAEQDFKITGQVTNLGNKPVAGAQILISSQKPAFIHTGLTDSVGRYKFEHLPQIDSGSFFIQARTAKGKDMHFGAVTVDRFRAPEISPRLADQLAPWYVNPDRRLLNYINHQSGPLQESNLQTGITLKEVAIVRKKDIKNSMNPMGPDYMDLVLDQEEIKKTAVMDLYELLKQRLPGFKVTRVDGYATMMLNDYDVRIIVDGGLITNVIQIDDPNSVEELIEELRTFKIAGFTGLEAVWNRRGTNRLAALGGGVSHVPATGSHPRIFGYQSNRPVELATIFITTMSGKAWYRINKPDVASYRPLPLMQPMEFYRPKYTSKNMADTPADFRSTILWQPEILTNADGRATVSFYTSDAVGSYTINLQGSNMEGQVGSATQTIKVEGSL